MIISATIILSCIMVLAVTIRCSKPKKKGNEIATSPDDLNKTNDNAHAKGDVFHTIENDGVIAIENLEGTHDGRTGLLTPTRIITNLNEKENTQLKVATTPYNPIPICREDEWKQNNRLAPNKSLKDKEMRFLNDLPPIDSSLRKQYK